MEHYNEYLKLVEGVLGKEVTFDHQLDELCKYLFNGKFGGVFAKGEPIVGPYAIINLGTRSSGGIHWMGVADDMVYDTMQENFTIVVEDLTEGEHLISVKVSDDIGNTTYKTFEINVAGN